jgi:uncharacterized protein DUF6798
VALVGLVFALSYGLRFGVHNQQTYLLHGLHRADPTLFARDWLVTRTLDYHPAFSVLVALLSRAGRLAWGLALLNVALLTAVALLVRALFHRLGETGADAAWLLLLGFWVFTDNKDVIASVADSALFPNYLGPSSLGALGLLAGLLFHLQGRRLASGMATALGGLFHVNYPVLAIPLFGLAQVLDRGPGLVGRLFRQLGPCLLLLLTRLPTLLTVAGEERATEARRLFLTVRSPHHYVPMSFLSDFAPFFGWMALGLVALLLLARGESAGPRRLRLVTAAAFVMVVTATLLTTVVYLPAVAQVYVWRLAPLAVLTAQIAFFTALSQRAAGRLPVEAGGRALVSVLVLIVGFVGLARDLDARSSLAVAILFLLAVMGGSAGATLFRRVGLHGQYVLATVGLVLFVLGTGRGLSELREEAAYLDAPLGGEDRMFGWARGTARDALFVIPPDLQEFRLCAERSVVVDWKSTPILPGELLEWQRRLLVVSGLEDLHTLDEVERGYARMGPRRMERLRQELAADFVVFHQPFPRTRVPEFPVAFADRRYIVFRLLPWEGPSQESQPRR